MGEPTKYILIEDEFDEEEKNIIQTIREFRRRFIRLFPEHSSRFLILKWFLYKDHDPRDEKGWKIMKTVCKKMRDHKIDMNKYFDYIFGAERCPDYYFLGSRTYLDVYLLYRRYEYKDDTSDLDIEKQMVADIMRKRNIKSEEDLFKKIPSITTILSKEYLTSNSVYNKLKESGYFKT